MFVSKASVALATLGLCSALGSASMIPRTTSKQVYPGFKNLKYLFSLWVTYADIGKSSGKSNLPWVDFSKVDLRVTFNVKNWGLTQLSKHSGPAWIDYLTVEYNKTELLTYNLAYGGATIDSALVTPWKPTVLSLKDQVESLFLPILGPKPSFAPWKSSDSLFLFWIGINDIGNSYWNQDFDNFHNTLMNEYFRLIEELYTSGARNFVFLNVPSIERSPLTIGQGQQAIDLETQALASYNTKVEERANALKKAHKDVWAEVFDSKKLFDKILDKPKSYDLKNTTSYCESYSNGTPAPDTFYPECIVPVDEYFWLNSLHPTAPVHKILAKELAKSL